MSRNDPQIQVHMSHGYGYPQGTFVDGKAKAVSISSSSSPEEFKQEIKNLYPRLHNKNFLLYMLNQQRKLIQSPFDPKFYKERKFQGNIIIKIMDPQISDEEPLPAPEVSHSITTSERQQPHTAGPAASSLPVNNNYQDSQISDEEPLPAPEVSHSLPVNNNYQDPQISDEEPLPAPEVSHSFTTSERHQPHTAAPAASSLPVNNNHNVTGHSRLDSPLPVLNMSNQGAARTSVPSPGINQQASSTWISGGTPDVTFHPRHRLRLEQDLEFAASLSMDREKEYERHEAKIRRNLERLERRRRRKLQREETERKKKALIEQYEAEFEEQDGENCILIIFQQPDGSEKRKSFPISESLLKLHNYAEALSDVVSARILLHDRQVLAKDLSTLKDMGITSNTRMIVEDSCENSEDTDSETEDESMTDQADDCVEDSREQLNDLQELEQRRISVFENLLPSKAIRVNRESLVKDVIDAYRLDPSLIHHQLDVTFKGEENAVDLLGVTREMFVVFFNMIFCCFFVGRNEKIPAFDHRILFDGTFEIIGKIISHCFVIVNYIPTRLSRAIYSMILARDCTDAVFMDSFLNIISEEEEILVTEARECELFTSEMKMKLLNLVSDYEGREQIKGPGNIDNVILSLAKTTIFAKPLFAISNLQKGMLCYPNLWNGVSLDLINMYLKKLKPNVDKVVSLIECQFSDEPTNRSREERILTFVEQYIRSLSERELEALLKFWTSSDSLCVRKLELTFNSLDGLQRRPISNTCSASLQVSRCYLSGQELKDEFTTVLGHYSSRMFDSA